MVVIHDPNKNPSQDSSCVRKNEHLSGLSGKKSESKPNLLYQLLANMLVKTVETFKTRCEDKDCDASVLLKIDTLSGCN